MTEIWWDLTMMSAYPDGQIIETMSHWCIWSNTWLRIKDPAIYTFCILSRNGCLNFPSAELGLRLVDPKPAIFLARWTFWSPKNNPGNWDAFIYIYISEVGGMVSEIDMIPQSILIFMDFLLWFHLWISTSSWFWGGWKLGRSLMIWGPMIMGIYGNQLLIHQVFKSCSASHKHHYH